MSGPADTFDVTINGEHLILFQNIHGEEDGSLNSENYLGSDEDILKEIAAFAKRVGRKNRWVIHPCHPKQVKKRFRKYRKHIIGDWDEVTYHYNIFGHILVVSQSKRRSIRMDGGIASFVQNNTDDVTNTQVELWESNRIGTVNVTITVSFVDSVISKNTVGRVIFHMDQPPFPIDMWD
jgi:hypothetical protein